MPTPMCCTRFRENAISKHFRDMTKLRHISFSRGSIPPLSKEDGLRMAAFDFSTDAISSFLTAAVRKAKIEVGAPVNALIVSPQNSWLDGDELRVRGGNLCVSSRVDWDLYDKTRDNEAAFGEHICAVFRQAAVNLSPEYGSLAQQLGDWIDAFQQAGYRHVWRPARKVSHKRGIEAELICHLDFQAFKLILKVQRYGTVIFDDVILTSDTNPHFYYYEFKALELEEDELSVTTRHLVDKSPLFRLRL